MPTSDNTGRPPARAKEHAVQSRPKRANSQQAAQPVPAPRSRFERWSLVALCALAAARVFFGAAAVPIFADTDEQAHFDLVHKFARGNWPTDQLVRRDPEACEIAVFYHSPEFTERPDAYADGRYPPPMRERPPVERSQTVAYFRAVIYSEPNHEAHSPPVYYALAGAWLDAGRMLFGQAGPREVYWTRFLNVPVFAALVALAYSFCQPYFGRQVGLAVAALTSFFPNTVFFTVNSDLLSPLLVLCTFMLLLRWCTDETTGTWLAAAVGVLAAAALLVKLTNAAVLFAIAAALMLRLWRVQRPLKLLLDASAMVLCVALPLLGWGLRNRMYFGDWTGTASKLAQLTWIPKPLGEMLPHKIFTPAGAGAFLTQLTANFFDGDSRFHGAAARSAIADTFLLITSGLLPAIGLAVAFLRGRQQPQARLAAGMSAILVGAFVGVLVALSLRFDFNQCDFPSRTFPFFTSGRLIAGGLVPFLTLYVCGIEAIVGRRLVWFAAAVVVTVIMLVLAQEPYLKLATVSRYNWFHLP